MKELRLLFPYLRPYWWVIIWGLVLVVISNALTVAIPFFIKQGIDALEQPGASPGVALQYAMSIVVVAILGGAARYGMRELLNGTSRRVEYDLRRDFFRHLLRLDAGFFGRMATGDIMSRATNDLQAVRMVAGPAYMYLINTVVIGILALALMMWIDVRLTLLALLPMLLIPPVTAGFGRAIHRRFERIQAQFGDLSTMVQENLVGVRLVKAFTQEVAQVERFRGLSGEYLERNLALARVSGLFHPTLGLLSGLGMVLVLWFGGAATIRGEISVGDFVAFGLYLAMLIWPMIALGWVVNLFQRAAASMARLNRVLELAPSVADPDEPVEPEAIRGEIEFRGVSFTYPGTERPVLSDITLRVPAGSTLAVVGPTGSGKSTLVNLLVRLHDPTEGEVLLDGVPISRLRLERLRSLIGIVPQDPFLFSDSIRANIAEGIDEEDAIALEVRVQEAARIAQLDDTVRAFPTGYETMLGERGVNLSGGQKQRATLARAIARDPVVLVLDDALSAVDTHTEHEILRGLRSVLADRTSILVSHRVSAVMEADRIVVLDAGRIVEEGTHRELLELRGLYASLQRRLLLAESLQDGRLLAPEPTDAVH